jgi:hypothetical protein
MYNFSITQGQTVEKTFTWKDINKELKDLTSYSAVFCIYNPVTKAAILTIIDTGVSPGIVLGEKAGTIQLTIAAAQTALLTFDFAPYYLKMTDGSDGVRYLLKGTITNTRTS